MSTDLLKQIESFTDPVQFERLCCDFLSLIGYLGIDPQGVGRRDGGKDAVFHHPVYGRIVFHFSLRADWRKKIEEDIEKVKSNTNKYDQFIFVTNRRVTAGEKDQLKLICRNRINCDLEIFDQERLRTLLSANKELCSRYFPDYFVSGIVLDRLITSVEKLVDQGLQIPKSERFRHAPRFLEESIAEVSALAKENLIEDVRVKTTEMTAIVSSISSVAAEGLFLIGCICFEQRQLGVAEEVWKKALVVDSGHFNSNFNLAVLMEYNSKGIRYGFGFRAEEAINFYDKAILGAYTPEERADCLDNKGVILLKTKGASVAKEYFSAAQKEYPEHLSSRLNLATVTRIASEDESEDEAAIDIFMSLFDTPLRDKALINLASKFIDTENWGKAILHLYHAKSRNNYMETYIQLFRIAYGRGRIRKARMYAERALSFDHDNALANYYLAQALLAEKKTESAIICLQRTIELSPEWHEPYLTIANAWKDFNAQASVGLQIEALQKALQLEDNLTNVHNALGNAYQQLGMFSNARIEYEKEIQLDPENEIPYFNLGVLAEYGSTGIRYGSIEGLRNAITYYRQALKHNPEYFPALFNIGTNLVLLCSYTEAVEVLEKALALSSFPTNGDVMSNLGIAYWKTGRTKEAVSYMQNAININPNNQYAKRALLEMMEDLFGRAF